MVVHAKVHLTIEARFRCDLLSGVFWTISNFQVYRCTRMVQIRGWNVETRNEICDAWAEKCFYIPPKISSLLSAPSPPPPNFPRAYKLHAARRIQIAAFNNANNAMNHGTTERFRRQPVLRVYRQVTEPAPRNIYNPSMEIQWSKIPNYSRGHVKCCRSRAINCHGAGNNNSMMESEFPWICRGCCLTLGLDDD